MGRSAGGGKAKAGPAGSAGGFQNDGDDKYRSGDDRRGRIGDVASCADRAGGAGIVLVGQGMGPAVKGKRGNKCRGDDTA